MMPPQLSAPLQFTDQLSEYLLQLFEQRLIEIRSPSLCGSSDCQHQRILPPIHLSIALVSDCEHIVKVLVDAYSRPCMPHSEGMNVTLYADYYATFRYYSMGRGPLLRSIDYP